MPVCLFIATQALAQSPCSTNPSALICDDFETYSLGNVSPQSNWWIPWDLDESSIVGSEVTTEFAYNGTKSMKVKLEGAGDDQLLQLGNKSSGRYDLRWKMYVPTGNAAYFNIQTDENDPGGSNANFSGQVFFRTSGIFDCNIPTPNVSGTYPQGVWFEVRLNLDLDDNLGKLFIDNKLVRIWTYVQSFGAIDFYSADAAHTFYIDQVEFIALPPANVDLCEGAVGLYNYFGKTPGEPQTTGLYNNSNASAEPSDPVVDCWGEPSVNTSMWYTFIGDGNSYHIETVPCNATNYIGGSDDPGDTQMIVYAGEDCNDLSEIACNDDLYTAGPPTYDWRAGVDFYTEPGQTYYMLIDGFNLFGTVATGQFCIEVTRELTIACAQGAVGNYTLEKPYLCFNGQLADLIEVDKASFVIPTEGPVYGMAWVMTTAPLGPGTWPSSPLASTPFLTAPFAVPYLNVGPNPLPPAPQGYDFGVYYLTPIVLGGGEIINPNQAITIGNINPNNGCFYTGVSTAVRFLPALNDLNASYTTGSGTVNLTPTGGVAQYLNDNNLYNYLWSNGAVTQDLSGVSGGLYTCLVSDESGCVDPLPVTVAITVGTEDPAAVTAFTLQPNPAADHVAINLQLDAARDLRLELSNTLGQIVLRHHAGVQQSLQYTLDLQTLAAGTYFLRINFDGVSAMRRLVISR